MSKIEHVAIIMDGNGRWAQARGRPRIWGHIRGSSKISEIVEEANDLGLKALTLFAFSSENWNRPQPEILTLFVLLKKYIQQERANIIKNKIRFKVIGEAQGLPQYTKKLIHDLEQETKDMPGLKLNFAFDYGGRNEIIRSVNHFIKEHPGQLISEENLYQNLYSPETGDVDLLIRTGGDYRISNFLLWQMAYAELFFTQVKWPDFSREHLRVLLQEVSLRERRFGGLSSDTDFETCVQKARQAKLILNSYHQS